MSGHLAVCSHIWAPVCLVLFGGQSYLLLGALQPSHHLVKQRHHHHGPASNKSADAKVTLGDSVPYAEEKCFGTLGSWCSAFHLQHAVNLEAYVPSSKECHGGCNGVGNCNLQLGKCDCMAGWTGTGCRTRQKRPCTNRHRDSGLEPQGAPHSLMEPGFTASRCGGVCDEDFAMCFCNGTRGRIAAPDGAPPGTLPRQMGRPMVLGECNPSKGDEGELTIWGALEPDLLFSKDRGWCEAADPKHRCASRAECHTRKRQWQAQGTTRCSRHRGPQDCCE